MPDKPYLNREIDEKFKDIKESLDRIEVQTTKHNGRMSKQERFLIILSVAVAALYLSKPELAKVVLSLII